MTNESSPPNTSVTRNKNTSRCFGVGTLLFSLLLNSAIVGGGVWWFIHEPGLPESNHEHTQARYQCPMHPSIIQNHPGKCPICGMELVAMDEENRDATSQTESPAVASVGRKPIFYRSPMDPKITSPTPRKDEMGMDYVPVYADEMADVSVSVEGRAVVNIDPTHQQLIGLTTAPVTTGPVGGEWRTVGRVVTDETLVRHINVKVAGFVERIYMDFVGKAVKKGDPLFAIYSPELLATQEEYLLALRMLRSFAKGPNEGDVLVRATRKKLTLWDIPKLEIDRLVTTGKTTKTLTIYSPVTGVITKKDVVEGMRLEAGAMPYEIVDLSKVWVLADVYESELRFVQEGIPATLILNAFPNREFKGKVLFIDPLLNPDTRTVKVRLAFSNPHGNLRPEMFGEVVLHGKPRVGLRIPQDAVIDSGTEKFVFVALGNGKFQPRITRLGKSSGKDVEVISGLEIGEQVVTRANFLIDSESKLRASLAEMSPRK